MKAQHTHEYQRAPRPLTHWLLLLSVVIATSLTGAAAPPPGQLLTAQCAQCHGTNGVAVSGFESIAGKKADDLYKSLLEMKARPPENIMDLQARAYTAAQLRLIANYLASLPPAAAETLDD